MHRAICGLALLVLVLAGCGAQGSAPDAGGTSRGYASLEGFRVSADGRRLTLVGIHGACDEVLAAAVDETPHEVRVSVPLDLKDGVCPAVGLQLEAAAALASPLGERDVVDDRTGDPLPRSR